jgi:hypothetical protein
MTYYKRKIDLLIREIDPADKNGRYLRENLRRIKAFLDELIEGGIAVGTAENANNALIASSPDSFNRYEVQYVSFDNQTNFTLANMPQSPDKVAMAVNGQDMTNGLHFTVSGQTVTFIPGAANFILEQNNQFGQPDIINFKYTV